ncbi:hypothetical protein DFH06DRAFT_1305485 [Mycena polygramma]|nr:hypothetical protein DFH06DRAFT_1305485 [Mycena polygramma]
MSILAKLLLALAPAPDSLALPENADGQDILAFSPRSRAQNERNVLLHAPRSAHPAPAPETHASPPDVSGQKVLGSMDSRAQDWDLWPRDSSPVDTRPSSEVPPQDGSTIPGSPMRRGTCSSVSMRLNATTSMILALQVGSRVQRCHAPALHSRPDGEATCILDLIATDYARTVAPVSGNGNGLLPASSAGLRCSPLQRGPANAAAHPARAD